MSPADHFICVDMPRLAAALALQLSDIEADAMLAVGSSGVRFGQQINANCRELPIETTCFAVQRERRILKAGTTELLGSPLLVDDIAVSGLTMATAVRALPVKPLACAVGMLYRSKTTGRRIGVADIRSAVTYSRQGGGNPPINSIRTLLECPERLEALTERYFGSAPEIKQILRGARQ